MPTPSTRRWVLALPIILYLVALGALRMHLPTGDAVPLVIALLAGALAFGVGAKLVLRHRVEPARLSSRG